MSPIKKKNDHYEGFTIPTSNLDNQFELENFGGGNSPDESVKSQNFHQNYSAGEDNSIGGEDRSSTEELEPNFENAQMVENLKKRVQDLELEVRAEKEKSKNLLEGYTQLEKKNKSLSRDFNIIKRDTIDKRSYEIETEKVKTLEHKLVSFF